MGWDEERAGQALRTLMREADLPPIGSDVERARRTGKRQAAVRRAVVAAAVAVIVTGTSAVAAATLRRDDSVELVADDRAVSCQRVQTLPLPPGTATALLAGADSSGRYAVGRALASRESMTAQTVLWKDKVPTVLNGVPAGDSPAIAVNSRGDVIGSPWATQSLEPTDLAWLYRDGRFLNLVGPQGSQGTTASAINDRGDIAGTVREGDMWHAIVWPADAPDKPRRLEAPENVFAYGIGADGTVVGETRAESGNGKGKYQPGQPYLWTKEGRGRELDVPAGWDGGTARGVVDGWVLGYLMRVETQEMAPVRWRVRGGPAQILGESSDSLKVVGNSGWFLSLTRPTGWSPTVLTYLNGRIRRGPEPTADPTRTGPGGEAIPVPVIGESALWVQEARHELTVLANGSPEEDAPKPVVWRCQV